MATTATFKTLIEFTWKSLKDDGFALNTDQNKLFSDVAYGVANEATQRIYAKRLTITVASATDDLDLTALTDGHGDSLSFNKVVALYVKNLDTTTGETLLIGGAGANAWSEPWNDQDNDQVSLGPTGELFITNPSDGWTVDSSNRLLRLELAGGTSSSRQFDIAIGGTISA